MSLYDNQIAIDISFPKTYITYIKSEQQSVTLYPW